MASILSKKQKQKQKTTKLSDLRALGHDLLSSRTHINNLPKLLSYVTPSSPPQYVVESLLSIQAFFTPVLPDLPSSSSKPNHSQDDDPEFIYRTWLRSKFDELVESLIQLLLSPECDETLKEVVLDTLMEFVKLGNGGKFHSAIFHRFLRNIVYSTTSPNFLVDLLASKYFKYIDVRYFTYISLEKLARTLDAKGLSEDRNLNADGNNGSHPSESMEQLIRNIHYIMSHIPAFEGSVEKTDYDMWSGSSESEGHSESQKSKDKKKTEKDNDKALSAANIVKKMKLKFTKAWLSFLRLPLPLDVYKEVLASLHQAVIPYISNPVVLCDFLTRSYDIGGVISVMALISLFIIMTKYGLEYPNFYEKLYALLIPSIFMAKHRSKFFQLLDSCLKSPLLPAYLAAAFAKKLSRLSISVPPSGALVIIALIHNLLRRHPSINCLVNRRGDEKTVEVDPEAEISTPEGADANGTDATDQSLRKPVIDPFDNEQSDPKKSNAMRSSLWEIDTLRHHYCPHVARFVVSLENDLTVRAKTTEISVGDFSSGSYATIFGEEMRRRVKQAPISFYRTTPTSLFTEPETDFLGWTFKCDDTKRKNDSTHENGDMHQESDRNSGKRQRVECS
ncbi:putative nucleolar complex protein [Rosa chinensis]|uniref:Putative nucleolar complex protein n=1 Tax=Rosa chinensis TaxID=74649 RepID=A0A2P6PTD0_ROSCH|nr:protein NUCLEOLAR COMPLEX ASSOCIATED 4 [Rosa chinensis]PRQ25192.1 putative nucleolar complex protein [Rosa chinensis]